MHLSRGSRQGYRKMISEVYSHLFC
jgi:hypothetical protein